MKRLHHVTALALLGLVLAVPLGCMDAPAERTRARDIGRAPADEATGRVRALHIAPRAPVLALTFDEGQPMVEGLRFGGITADVPMVAGAHAFDVLRVDDGALMTSSELVAVEAAGAFSLVVWGDVDDMRVTALTAGEGQGYRVMNAQADGIDTSVGALASGAMSDVGSDDTLVIGEDSYTLPSAEAQDSVVDIFVVGATDGNTGLTVLACTTSGLVVIPADGPLPAARIRAIHLSANAPSVDVLVNGAVAFAGLVFERASAYAELAPDRYDIDVAPAGTTTSVLNVSGLELLSATSYSAVAFGALPNIVALALVDDLSPTAPGKIRVRAVHTADGVGQVDLLAIGTAGNTVVYDDVNFGSATDFIEIDAAAITLGLDLDDDSEPELVFDVPALPVGTVATLFAVADAQGVALFAVLEDGTALIRGAAPVQIEPARIRVVHLSPDAPAVAVNANGARIVESLAFFNATDFLAVAAGLTDLDVALAASPTAPLLSLVGADLAPSSFTTAIAFGRASSLRVLALAEDRSAPAAGNIRVRAVHTAVGVGDVDVYAIVGGAHVKLYDDLAFGTAGDAMEVAAGQYGIGLDLDDDGHAELTFDLPSLPAGAVANLYAVTDATGAASLAIQQ